MPELAAASRQEGAVPLPLSTNCTHAQLQHVSLESSELIEVLIPNIAVLLSMHAVSHVGSVFLKIPLSGKPFLNKVSHQLHKRVTADW